MLILNRLKRYLPAETTCWSTATQIY